MFGTVFINYQLKHYYIYYIIITVITAAQLAYI